MGDTVLPQGAGYGVVVGTVSVDVTFRFFSLGYRHRFILQRLHAGHNGHSGAIYGIFA